MNKVSSLIQEFFPEEEIQKEYKGILRDSWAGKVGKFPVGKSKYFYLKPMEIVETNYAYYFDRRQPFTFQSKVSLITIPIFLVIILMAISKVIWDIAMPALVYVIVFEIGLLISFLNLRINQSIVNIVVLKKNWIAEEKNEGEWHVLQGKIPSGENYSFAYSIPVENRNNLSLLDKLFSGALLGNALKGSSLLSEFTFRIKRV